ncbi:response regulator [Paenibacillus sp. P25]|nr:response regulator [Paenibacillus sp. P25]
MYKVMLVDDDYPVLEFLSEAIPWEKYGLQLVGRCENGAVALAQAERDMPDILITDIGMPKMDGIELIGSLKQRKPGLRVAILSCHSDFHYAQQALKLNVQDYVLKDTLDPASLEKPLQQFKESLDQEDRVRSHSHQLQDMVDRNKEPLKEKFIRKTMQRADSGPAGLAERSRVVRPEPRGQSLPSGPWLYRRIPAGQAAVRLRRHPAVCRL